MRLRSCPGMGNNPSERSLANEYTTIGAVTCHPGLSLRAQGRATSPVYVSAPRISARSTRWTTPRPQATVRSSGANPILTTPATTASVPTGRYSYGVGHLVSDPRDGEFGKG